MKLIAHDYIKRMLRQDNRFYVYVLKYNGVPFYVGKGRGHRMYQHEANARNRKSNTPLYNYIRKIWAVNCGIVSYHIIDLFDDENEALKFESEMIKQYGRRDQGIGSLVNLTDGGKSNAGRIASKEWRQKKSAEMKAKLVDPRNHPRYGVNLTEETKRKISKSLTGKKASIETRLKQSVARKGIKKGPMSAEQKEHLAKVKSGKATWFYRWFILSPDGKKYFTFNLKKFCRDYNLNQGNMYQVAKGKKFTDKGWTCRKESNHKFTVRETECLSAMT